MAAMEAKKSKEKDVKPAGQAPGVGRGRGGTKEGGRPAPGGGGGGHRGIELHRTCVVTS